jgi:hypothetical protein
MKDAEKGGKFSVNFSLSGLGFPKNAVVKKEKICYNTLYYGKCNLLTQKGRI